MSFHSLEIGQIKQVWYDVLIIQSQTDTTQVFSLYVRLS